MKRILLIVTALFAVTAWAGDKPLKVWRDAGLNTWENYYGKPAKIENLNTKYNLPDDGSRAYTWNIARFEVEATFSKNSKLSVFNIEARTGEDPLTFTEAQALADKLGFGPYHNEDGVPSWGGDGNSVSAFFDDAHFHFEAQQDPKDLGWN